MPSTALLAWRAERATRLDRLVAAGWPITLQSARRWRSTLDALAAGLDRVTGEHLWQVFGATAW